MGSILFLQIIFGIVRGRWFGAKLSFSESFYLLRNYNLRSDFLKGLAALREVVEIKVDKAHNLYHSRIDLKSLAIEMKKPENNGKRVERVVAEMQIKERNVLQH